MTFKVLLKIPMSPYSGYGNDGIGMARAFMQRGADVYVQPTNVQAPLPQDVAMLLTKELKAPFDLTIVHVDPAALEASVELKAASKTLIGWTMWEYSNLLNLPKKNLKALRKNLSNFDMLVGYDQVSADGLKEYFDGPVVVQQGGYWPEDWPEIERDWNTDTFHFFMIGVLSERKDPFVAVQAFSELKNEHEDFDKFARLSLKTTAPGLHSKMEDVYPGLRVFYDMWSTDIVKQFYAAQHVLLAPSRGEGKNMPALEFQSTGGTVIATNWGGHQQWLNPDYNYALDYTLEPVNTDNPQTLNARASVEHLKELMLHTFRNRAEAQQKGAIAAQIVPALASWDSVITRLLLKIKYDAPEGERVWMLDQIAGQEHARGDA